MCLPVTDKIACNNTLNKLQDLIDGVNIYNINSLCYKNSEIKRKRFTLSPPCLFDKGTE